MELELLRNNDASIAAGLVPFLCLFNLVDIGYLTACDVWVGGSWVQITAGLKLRTK